MSRLDKSQDWHEPEILSPALTEVCALADRAVHVPIRMATVIKPYFEKIFIGTYKTDTVKG